ncbi:hypothetical protein [Microbacterium trichothecenolyticum]|uniref:Uncharacterized protein n=1 Tax=Microbacterium trichothecenolyticum TaxID=69370 RepID=A0ABU0TX21_MICTR|nr:hypothetical protein [Microbacterium trichothecenolyticum]MDQ1123482.1 hypothetical protein [Microbacterium trichothecenolyticum]
MTTTRRPGAGVVWARVEEGFHVASRHGVFIGYLDRAADDTYLAFDGRPRPLGRFANLVAAMSAVLTAHAQPPSPDDPIVLRQVHTSARSLPYVRTR